MLSSSSLDIPTQRFTYMQVITLYCQALLLPGMLLAFINYARISPFLYTSVYIYTRKGIMLM